MLTIGEPKPVRFESRLKRPDRADQPTEVGAPPTTQFSIGAAGRERFAGKRYFPDEHAAAAVKLRVTAELESTFVDVRAYVGEHTICFGASGPASQQDIIVPEWFDGYIEVTREDLGPDPATAFISLEEEPFAPTHAGGSRPATPGWFLDSAAHGYSTLQGITFDGYNRLAAYAECDYLNKVERGAGGCRQAQITAPPDRGGLGLTIPSPSHQIYTFVSEVIGRNAATEFGNRPYTHASHSEPMIVFFGLSGMNRVLLLDCRVADGQSCRAGTLAEPWQTSLQQADYVWAVYLEDDQSPFDTSIDVEYRGHGPDLDYDEFDPRARTAIRRSDGASAGPARENTARFTKVLRVGAKRLRIRDAPVEIVVAFTRRGPNYGVRQWRRSYTKLSSHWWAIAGTVTTTVKPVRPRSVSFRPEPRNDFLPPTAGRLVQEEGDAWVYAGPSFRFTGIRARALDLPGPMQKFLLNLIPDYTSGVAIRQGHLPILLALSWPTLIDRLSLVAGVSFVPQPAFQPGFGEAQLLPLTTSFDTVRRYVWEREYVFGISLDVMRTK